MYDNKYLLSEETLDYLAEDRDEYLEKNTKKVWKIRKKLLKIRKNY